jgi:hypothetical protein
MNVVQSEENLIFFKKQTDGLFWIEYSEEEFAQIIQSARIRVICAIRVLYHGFSLNHMKTAQNVLMDALTDEP